MLKILHVPLQFGDKNFIAHTNAFRELGCNVELFDYFYYYNETRNVKKTRNMFLEKVRQVQPDLIHAQIQHTTILDGEIFRQAKQACPNIIITNYTIDCRNYIQPQYLAVGKHADYNLICSTGQWDMYNAHNLRNVMYWQVGYDPNIYYPETSLRHHYDFDIAFSGNVNAKENYPGHHERIQTAYALKRAFGNRFGLFGSGWPRDLDSLGSIEQDRIVIDSYHRSFSVLSVSHFNQIDHYFSDRLLMCLSSGRPTICWKFPKYQSYFADKCDLVIAEGADDIINKTKYLLEHKDEANFIGMNGAAKVYAEHSYHSKIRELLDMIGLSGKL